MISTGLAHGVESTLLRPKLALPTAPPQLVHRPRLIALLDTGATRPVTFVVGPAGFGKTVLVCDWLSRTPGRAIGWVSLDASDDAPSRFWTYVLAALTQAGAEVPAGPTLIATAGSAPPAESLAILVNSLAEIRHDVFLVLDDYHVISDPTIHRDLTFLIDQQLTGFHLVIMSRREPQLTSARWKAHGLVTQVRARHLAFSREEATTYLGDRGVFLSADIWKSLYSRVEGWVAGLQLVALWSADREDHNEAITEFAAGDVNIADYLTNEVLSELPDNLRRFLFQTSILPRLNGSLCDAVTGEDQGASTLRHLYHRGLFLESLDTAHEWFRYHHLFAELLRNELRRAHPDMMSELHRRASVWCEINGLGAEAIDHSIQAEDWASVQRLMFNEVLLIGTRYEPAVVERWLTSLPSAVLRTGPVFQLLYAFVLGHTARLDEAQQGIDCATDLMETPGADAELPDLRALISVVAAGIARLNCDLDGAKARALEVEAALSLTGRGETDLGRMSRAAAGISVATSLFFHGEVVEAERRVGSALRWTNGQFLVRMHANGKGTKALVLASTGRLTAAKKASLDSLAAADSVGITELFQANGALLASALIASERGDAAEAALLLDSLAARADRHADRGVQVIVAVQRAQLAAVRGNASEGLAILERQRSRWPGWAAPAALRAAVDGAEIRLCLHLGDLAAAKTVLARLSSLDGRSPVVAASQQLSAGLVLGAHRRFDESLSASQRAEQTADSAGLGLVKLQAIIQAAVVQQSRGREQPALNSLQRALLLAQEEEIVAPFLAVGRSMRPMLLSIDTIAEESSTRVFRQDLLARLGIPTPGPPRRSSIELRTHSLTDRELTVLRLLSGSLTSVEIADSLRISVNTLKTHTRQIYSKLGVNNRQDAVRQASTLSMS